MHRWMGSHPSGGFQGNTQTGTCSKVRGSSPSSNLGLKGSNNPLPSSGEGGDPGDLPPVTFFGFVFVSKTGSFLRSLIGSRLPRRCGPHPLPAKRETRPLPSDNDPERERELGGDAAARRRQRAPAKPRHTAPQIEPALSLSGNRPAPPQRVACRLETRTSPASRGAQLLTEMRPTPDARPKP